MLFRVWDYGSAQATGEIVQAEDHKDAFKKAVRHGESADKLVLAAGDPIEKVKEFVSEMMWTVTDVSFGGLAKSVLETEKKIALNWHEE